MSPFLPRLPHAARPLALAALLCALALTPAAAQSRDRFPPLSPEERTRLFAELEQQTVALASFQNVLKTVVRLASPTVVHIQWKSGGRYSSRSGRSREVEEAGSGVIIKSRDRAYILTNWHVVRDAELAAIEIRMDDGRRLRAQDVWRDPPTDVAVIAVEESDLIPARLGNSDELEIGDFVIAVGSPFGLSHSVTYGIISAKGRRQLELGDDGLRFQDFLQTDAAINPGNSGGPLISLRGEVIGLNTAIASNSGGNEGIGFSIPINMVMTVARQLIEHGKVNRAFLGVTLDKDFTPATATRLGLPRPYGARIIRILPKSAAEAAHLEIDDVILEFNHVVIEDDLHLQNVVSLTEVGKQIPVTVFRAGKEQLLTVTVGDRAVYEPPANQNGQLPPTSRLSPAALAATASADAWDIAVLGLTVVELNPDLARRLNSADASEGLLVTEVDPHGPAVGRIAPGEVLGQIATTVVRRIDDLERALSTADLVAGIEVRVISLAADKPQVRTVRLAPRVGTDN